ncbi:DUF2867 domain-containing protein [Ferrimonas marina]|uniref:DUF2867 domain-containing protein n=1 Tax=Ferrimonas marina TaxID=299255 RepID=UPI00190E6E4B|nr:DUF2867 domain-containing protein [Ferrimonas marina]
MSEQPKVLVLGASGFVGANLVPALVEQGYPVRAASRRPAQLALRRWPVELCRADVLQQDTLAEALEGVDTVYYLIHAMTEGAGFDQREQQGARNLAEAAQQAGVKRIIYLGALHPEGADSTHLRSRSQTGELLRSGGAAVTEIRAPVIIGPGSAAFEVMRDLVYNLPGMITPKWVRSKMAPIALPDLLHYLIGVLSVPQTQGCSFDVCGPDVLSYEQQMRAFGRIVDRPVRILAVPFLSPGLSARWLRWITSVPTGIAKALVGGLKQDLLADDSAIQALLPRELMGFEQAVRWSLAQEREQVASASPPLASLLRRRWQPQYGFYAKQDGAERLIDASPQEVWSVISQIGAAPRYFAFDPLWRIREAMDAMVGGRGLAYYRRDPLKLALGDRVDSWTVAEHQPQRRLTLLFGMKAPGMGGLTFELHPVGRQTELRLTCWWYPSGAWGLMYWWAMLPAHILLFRRMVANIGRLSGSDALPAPA